MALLATAAAAWCLQASAQDTSTNMAAMRDTLNEWVETRKLIADARNEWALDKDVLESRIDLIRSQVEGMRERTKEAREKVEKAKATRGEKDAENKQLKDAVASLETRIDALEKRTLTVLASLPEPVQRKVKPVSQQIPKNAEEADKHSLSTRYSFVIGTLDAVNKFNNDLILETEQRDFEGGKSMEVTVMYIGLGQAYFCNEKGTVGGTGRPGPKGWKWERNDEIAPYVAAAIAVYKNEKPAEYVPLPVEIVATPGE